MPFSLSITLVALNSASLKLAFALAVSFLSFLSLSRCLALVLRLSLSLSLSLLLSRLCRLLVDLWIKRHRGLSQSQESKDVDNFASRPCSEVRGSLRDSGSCCLCVIKHGYDLARSTGLAMPRGECNGSKRVTCVTEKGSSPRLVRACVRGVCVCVYM